MDFALLSSVVLLMENGTLLLAAMVKLELGFLLYNNNTFFCTLSLFVERERLCNGGWTGNNGEKTLYSCV